MDIDTLIERQEVLVENQKQLLSAMVSTLDLMKAEKLRQEIDQEIAFDEPNKTVDQEEDPRVQKHKIIALKNGYTPEDVEEVASIYRSYYESLDEIEADLAAEGKPNALLSYVREARECLNSGKQLPQRPTRSSITLEKPNEEVAVPLSEQTPEETAVPDLNSAPEISIPSSNNEEVMQHQNTTPESPEAEHQQAKMENLMDISLPLVDQEPFQEILQALLKNDMSQAANLLQYLGSHLDKLQEEHQKMQVEFRELKEQVNSIDERFFNDSDSVDTVQNNLDQSEKLITLNKSRLANVVLQTKSKLKTAGKNALLSFAEKIHVPKALASLQKGMQHTQDSLDVLFQRLNDAKQAVQDVSNSVKNVGRALTGKELLEYVPWDPEKGKIASVQRKIYAMERTLGNLQERTNTLLSKMQRPEQKPEKQVKKTTKKVI